MAEQKIVLLEASSESGFDGARERSITATLTVDGYGKQAIATLLVERTEEYKGKLKGSSSVRYTIKSEELVSFFESKATRVSE